MLPVLVRLARDRNRDQPETFLLVANGLHALLQATHPAHRLPGRPAIAYVLRAQVAQRHSYPPLALRRFLLPHFPLIAAACRPNLTRLRCTSAPKSSSLRSR